MTSIDSKQAAAEGAGRHSPHADPHDDILSCVDRRAQSLAGRALTAAQVLALQPRRAGTYALLSPAQLLALQRTNGNAAVARLLARSRTRPRPEGAQGAAGAPAGQAVAGEPETAPLPCRAVRSLLRHSHAWGGSARA